MADAVGTVRRWAERHRSLAALILRAKPDRSRHLFVVGVPGSHTCHPFLIQTPSLLRFLQNVHSQNGEDGVVAEIFRRLEKTSPGWFVEFGAWDGKYLSNTFTLLEQGWSGVYIEGDSARFEDLKATRDQYPERVTAIKAFVDVHGTSSLDSILAKTATPPDFDLLSIDIDSYDYWIWDSVRFYRPKIVIIEINSAYPPGVHYVSPPDVCLPEEQSGQSFSSTIQLGRSKGYFPVCHTGNLIFARADLVGKLALPTRELRHPDLLFVDSWLPVSRKRRFRVERLLKNCVAYIERSVGFPG